MRDLYDGMIAAFSMYTILPVPSGRWGGGGMRYTLCFLPLVGLAVMCCTLGWLYVAVRFALSPIIFAVVAALLPVWLSGGIHMDGLIDTRDALASHEGAPRKLEILSDPHIGAFGLLGCVSYLLVSAGAWHQVFTGAARLALLPAAGQVLGRALAGLSIVNLPCARTSGLCRLFSDHASRRAVRLWCGGGVCACALFALWADTLWGGVALAGCVVCWLRHRRQCAVHFGGNTGDLAGYLLQKIELVTLLAAAAGGIVS